MDFEVWYSSNWKPLVRLLMVLLGRTSDAEDIAAEAFSRALERWTSVSEMDDPFRWTVTVALNLGRRRARRAALERRLWIRRTDPITVEQPIPADIWAAVDRLPIRQRQAIALRYVLDMTQRDLASALGVAPGTAAAALNAARKNLGFAPELSRGEAT